MTGPEGLKPSYDEWMYWTQVIVDRLTTVTYVYGNPPHPDVFMPDRERQTKLSLTVDVLRHLHEQTDLNDLHVPHESTDAGERETRFITALQPLYVDVLRRMPTWSDDMQKLLKSPWYDNCAGKLANILFRGPDGRETEGLGSGYPENGRLPEVIEKLLEREAISDIRAPRIEKPRFTDPNMRREELAKLWVKKNSSFLRSAGRMD